MGIAVILVSLALHLCKDVNLLQTVAAVIDKIPAFVYKGVFRMHNYITAE